MKKLKYLGIYKSEMEDKIEIKRIYINPKTNTLTCIKKDGTEKKLSDSEKIEIRKKYKEKIKKLGIQRKRKYILAFLLLATGVTLGGKKAYQNRYVLTNDPTLYLKMLQNEELDVTFLAQKCGEYIDRNENYTPEQKRNLKEFWGQVLLEEGKQYETSTYIQLLNSLAENDVKYRANEEDNAVKGETAGNKIIRLNREDENTIVHESIHNAFGRLLAHMGIEEGYCCATMDKYCKDISYLDENENLLIMKEIIGKDKLIYCIINGKENELYEALADKTKTDKKQIKELIKSMDEVLKIDRKARDKEEKNEMEEAENLKIKAEQIHKEIRIAWANLAILADENNENNFIIQNALAENRYTLYTSFLSEEYTYIIPETKEIIVINENNKYESIENLQAGEYSLTKTKPNN